GPYTFKVQGTVSHVMGSLLPPANERASFSQIYFYEPEEQVQRRNELFDQSLDRDLLWFLQDIVLKENPFVQVFLTAREREMRNPSTGNETLKIVLRSKLGDRQYDLTSTNEFAVLLPSATPTIQSRDVIIQGRDNHLQRIMESSTLYDPLHYVLLHPKGDHG